MTKPVQILVTSLIAYFRFFFAVAARAFLLAMVAVIPASLVISFIAALAGGGPDMIQRAAEAAGLPIAITACLYSVYWRISDQRKRAANAAAA